MALVVNGGGLPPIVETKVTTQIISLGQDLWWIGIKGLAATGAAVTLPVQFDYPFKLIAILLEHTSSVGALSADPLTWSFNVAPRGEIQNNFPIVSYIGSTASQFLEMFGDDFLFPIGTYRFIYNTTNTDLINLVLIIQKRKVQ